MVRLLHLFICAVILSTAQVSFAQDANRSLTTSSAVDETALKSNQMKVDLVFEDETIQPEHPFLGCNPFKTRRQMAFLLEKSWRLRHGACH